MTDKLLENFAQLLILSVVVPLLFALITPTAREAVDDGEKAGKVETKFLRIFDEDDYYKSLSETVELVVGEVQIDIDRIDGKREVKFADDDESGGKTDKKQDKKSTKKTDKKSTEKNDIPESDRGDKLYGERRSDTDKAEENGKGLAGALYQLFVGSAVVSLLGGLLIMLCFNIWRPLTEWSGICVGIWPVVPAVICAYIGCYIVTLEGKETFIRNFIYILAVANFSFVLLKSQYHRTAVVWQLVKGMISALIGCAICAGAAGVFCMYAMIEKSTISGKAAYLTVFGVSLASGILMAIEDKIIDSAEKYDTY